MANIFNALAEFVNKPNRNTFDMSFQNNLTMNFGTLFPVFCKEVIPGDSFRIRPTFGLRFMPLVFPIQTRMQANLHFFYVRNRNLWKDWPDFIGNTKKDLVPPYIASDYARDIFHTGAIGDYLGVPTTLAGSYGQHFEQNKSEFYNGNRVALSFTRPVPVNQGGYIDAHFITPYATLDAFDTFTRIAASQPQMQRCRMTRGFVSAPFDLSQLKQYESTEGLSFSSSVSIRPRLFEEYFDLPVILTYFLMCEVDGSWRTVLCHDGSYSSSLRGLLGNAGAFFETGRPLSDVFGLRQSLTDNLFEIRCNIGVSEICPLVQQSDKFFWDIDNSFIGSDEILSYLRTTYNTTNVRFGFSFCAGAFNSSDGSVQTVPNWSETFGVGRTNEEGETFEFAYLSSEFLDDAGDAIRDITDVPRTLNPFLTGSLKVSALPFRAYESIYNAFYRNQFNDPFMIDGQKEYNKFLRNTDGGADHLNYELYNRNWELDFLTSARQSPVDGDITPLVGVTGSGKFVFENEDGTRYTVTPVLGEDGHTLTGIESIQGTPENNSGLRRLIDMASVGISINDFRNVNALQRWLETNLRRGYRYRDQIMSHFGVDVKYEELDMPEFIGGMSEPVMVNQVNQMSDQTDSPSGLGDFSKVLGSFAGQASILAQSRHEITKYCDEHGFIIGILSVSPVPNYSQLLPRHFIKNSVLDYYFPTFGHIGNQPITYREVCPLQSFAAGDSLDDVFGYQRAWYDYIASVDEVHGDFRTSLEGFLINRVFASRPELGKEFITIDKDSMSNPFSVTDETDKILGEVYFDVQAQRPIPKLGIPRLE